MTIGDRYEIIDLQLLQSVGCLNVYYYKHITGVGGDAVDLVSAFNFYVYPSILDIQTNNLTHVSLAVRNVDDPTDWVLLPRVPPDPGLYMSDTDYRFVAASYMLHRQTLDVRNGWKRYAGVPDSGVEDGVPITAYLTNLNALAAVLDDDITGVAGGVYEPRIMRKVDDPILGLTYTDFPMGVAEFRGISTQNTRKK